MLAEQFDAFLMDLDGVVYVGDRLLPGAGDVLSRLRGAGKALRFLTNDPRPTRAEVAQRLRVLGIEAHGEEVVSCGWATAQYARRAGIRSAFVVGSPGLREELEAAGIAVVSDGVPDAVVVGADERVGYREIVYASRYIERGAEFIALNVDASFPTPAGPAPATGAVVRAVETATGRRPLVVGKPSATMFELALATLPRHARVVMIGDNPESDVLGAHQVGIPAVLVAEQPPQYPAARDFRRPDACIRTLLDVFDPGIDIREWTNPGFPWPERVVAAVAVVALDPNGHVLLARRAPDGLWELPWCVLERGESLVEAAWRAVQEAGGPAPVRVDGVFGLYTDPGATVTALPSGEVVQLVVCGLRCVLSSADVRDSGGNTAVRSPDALPHSIPVAHRRWIEDALARDAGNLSLR